MLPFNNNNNAALQAVRNFGVGGDHFLFYSFEPPVMPSRNRARQQPSSQRQRHRRPRNGETLYFAFGSNLWLTQMADRCPESRYVGRAILRDYRWQINQRGFANVVPSANSQVEGLCYVLSANDEARLDRSEGVPTAYQKSTVNVTLFPADPIVAGRRTSEMVQRDLARRVAQRASQPPAPGFMCFPCSYTVPSPPPVVGQNVRALIYMSANYTRSSAPRQEYRERMQNGIRDARRLGMSSAYVSNVLRPALDRR